MYDTTAGEFVKSIFLRSFFTCQLPQYFNRLIDKKEKISFTLPYTRSVAIFYISFYNKK